MKPPPLTFPCHRFVVGYRTGDEVQVRIECSWCGDEICAGEPPASHGICDECRAKYFPDVPKDEPLPCTLCGRPIREGSPWPLCSLCEATARAAGRQANEARRYPDPEIRP